MSIVSYELKGENGQATRFDIDIDRPACIEEQNSETHPEWTHLANNQCPNCPLSTEEVRYCPAAIEIEQIATHFIESSSIDRCDVTVTTDERSYFKNTDMQSALRSLFGLVMASGACPILARLKPLAHFHLPFATLQETIHRMVGTYLIGQYLQHHDEQDADWDLRGIEDLYTEIKQINLQLMKRVRVASKEDASINAIQTFISIASIIEMGVDDVIEKMEPILRKGL